MKVQSSSVAMSGESAVCKTYNKQETMCLWKGNSVPDSDGLPGLEADVLNISKEGKAMHMLVPSAEEIEIEELEISDKDKQKLLMIQKMIEALTGKKIKFYIPRRIRIKVINDGKTMPVNRNNAPAQGWGLIYESKETYTERERMSFSAAAEVLTFDGKRISVRFELNMSREFAYSNHFIFRAGDAVKIDPLAINLDVPSAKLTQNKFVFDLDSDGKTESISILEPGSGFIALDRNNDGIVNNGSELFGTLTGDGFGELAAYDSDSNRWIDENDPIYDRLRIWTKDESGRDILFALGQKGVGAIYLGGVVTNFNLKDSNNALHGQIRKTGIYLKENGTAGVIQHIDIAV